MKEKRRHPFRKLILLCFVLVAGLAVAAYAVGWIKLDRTPEKTTIEIETGEMKEAADKAVEKGRKLVEDGKELAEDAGESMNKIIDSEDKETPGSDTGDDSVEAGEPAERADPGAEPAAD